MALLSRYQFYLVSGVQFQGEEGYANTSGALDGIIRWSAIFLAGPAILWIDLLLITCDLLQKLRRISDTGERWTTARKLVVILSLSS